MDPTSGNGDAARPLYVRLLRRKDRHVFGLELLRMHSNASGETLVKEISISFGYPGKDWLRRWMLCEKTVVATSEILVHSADVVEILSITPKPLLTEALERPELLRATQCFLERSGLRIFEGSVQGSTVREEAVTLIKTVDRPKVCVRLFVITLTCLILGVVAGLVSRRADLAVAISSLLVTILSVGEMLLIWALAVVPAG